VLQKSLEGRFEVWTSIIWQGAGREKKQGKSSNEGRDDLRIRKGRRSELRRILPSSCQRIEEKEENKEERLCETEGKKEGKGRGTST